MLPAALQKLFFLLPLKISPAEFALFRHYVMFEHPVKPAQVIRTVETPVKTASHKIGIRLLRILYYLHRHLHVLPLPHNAVIQYELVLILYNAHTNSKLHRTPRLALRYPSGVLLEHRKHLLLVRYHLCLQ